MQLWRVLLDSKTGAKQAAAVEALSQHAFGPSVEATDANLKMIPLEPPQKPKEEMELTFIVDNVNGFEKLMPSVQLDFVDANGGEKELDVQGWTFLTCTQDASKNQSTVRVIFNLI